MEGVRICLAGPFSQSGRGCGAGCASGSCRCGPGAPPGVCVERHTQVRCKLCAVRRGGHPHLTSKANSGPVEHYLLSGDGTVYSNVSCLPGSPDLYRLHRVSYTYPLEKRSTLRWSVSMTASTALYQSTLAIHRCSATGKVLPAVEVLCPSMLPGGGQPVANSTNSHQDGASVASSLASATRTARARSASDGGSSEEAHTPQAAAPAVAEVSGECSCDSSGHQIFSVQLGSIEIASRGSLLGHQPTTDGGKESEDAMALAGV